MATDSTELTFVRCPSCRSLVPAVSTRCRMCGATLDASQRSEEGSGEEQRRSGRVRQRTMSQPSSELANAAGRVRQENVPPADEVEPQMQATSDEAVPAQEPSEDPLSAYIEEVQIAEDEPPTEASPSVEELFGREEEKPAESEPGVNGTGEEAFSVVSEEAPEPEPAAPAPEIDQEPKPRVVIESGPRRGGKPGLSFGRKPENREERREHREERREQRDDRREVRGEKRDNEQRPRFQDREHENRQPRPEQKQARPVQDERREAEPVVAKEEGESAIESRRPEPQGKPAAAMKREAGSKGRLCGWLVSYADGIGSAVELREGRFFVTQASLKPSDLVLDNPSVSTPHALLSSAAGDSLRVQDLLSEEGVHVRRARGDSFQRISDAVSLEHGDSVRFGEVEFIVTLVPQK